MRKVPRITTGAKDVDRPLELIRTTLNSLADEVAGIAGTTDTEILDAMHPTRPNADADDVLDWHFSEVASPYLNRGNGGACNFVATGAGGAPTPRWPGPYGGCVACTSTRYLCTARPAPVTIPANFSLAAVCRVNYVGADSAMVITKKYANDATWNSPYNAAGIRVLTSSNSYRVNFEVATTGGTWRQLESTPYHYAVGRWTLLAMTWDNGTHVLNAYVDGVLANTATYAGQTLDKGGDAEWTVGGRHLTDASQPLAGMIAHVRVSQIVRPATYWAAWYAALNRSESV